jgi:hypothetical protein
MSPAYHSNLWRLLRELIASGHADLDVLRRYELGLGRDDWHRRDVADDVLNQRDWDSDRWPRGGL